MCTIVCPFGLVSNGNDDWRGIIYLFDNREFRQGRSTVLVG